MLVKLKKFIIWFLLIGAGLIISGLITLQLPVVQNYIANEVLEQVNNKTNAPISIEKIRISFFNRAKIKNLSLKTESGDTLVFASEIIGSIKLYKLLQDTIYIRKIILKDAKIHLVKQRSDSALNIVSIFRNQKNQSRKKAKNMKSNILLGKLFLQDIEFTFKNQLTLSKLEFSLTKLNLKLNAIDVAQKKIDIEFIRLNTLRLEVLQTQLKNPEKNFKEFPFELSLRQNLKAKDVNLRIKNTATSNETKIASADLKISPDYINLKNNKLALKDISLSNANVIIREKKITSSDSLQLARYKAQKQNQDFLWDIRTNKLKLSNNSYTSIRQTSFQAGNTDTIFSLERISSLIEKIRLKRNMYMAKISSMEFTSNNTFHLSDLSAKISIGKTQAHLFGAEINTKHSSLNIDAEFNFRDLKNIKEQLQEVSFLINYKGNINATDYSVFLTKSKSFRNYPNMNIGGTFEGKLKAFQMKDISIETARGVSIRADGELNDLINDKIVNGKIHFKKLYISKAAVNYYLADSVLPNTIEIPDSLMIRGEISGSGQNSSTSLIVQTSYGKLSANITTLFDSIPTHEFFNAQIQTQNFQLGKLLKKQDSLGQISFKGKIEGSTQNFKKPFISLKLNVGKIEVMQYRYTGLLISGSYKKDYFNGRISIHDKNLDFNFNGKVNLSNENPGFNFDLALNHAFPEALNLTDNYSYLKAKLNSQIKGKKLNRLQGSFFAESLIYETKNRDFSVDSLKAKFNNLKDSSIYHIKLFTLKTQDTVLTDEANIQASLLDTTLKFSYLAKDKNRKTDSLKPVLDGTGVIYFSENSLSAQTNFLLKKTTLHDSLKYKARLSRQLHDGGLQEISLFAKGKGLSLNISGNIKDKDRISGSVNIDSLNMELIRPFLGTSINELRGLVSAKGEISGTTKSPGIKGYIRFDNMVVEPTFLGTKFILDKEQISFDNKLIKFDNLTMEDVSGSKAFIDGVITLGQKEEPSLDLNLNMNKFQLLNKSATQSKLYYGNIIADIDADISGSFSDPDVVMKTSFNNNSNFVFIVPQNRKTAHNRQGIIEFTDSDSSDNLNDTNNQIKEPAIHPGSQNFSFTSEVSISDQLHITLITDPASDENLEFSGNGNLSFSMNQNGDMDLLGKYKIEDGKYRLRLFDVIRREFEIEKGSSLTWSGDIMDATADITAFYKVNTTPIALVQETNLSQEEIQKYNTPMDLEVIMHIKEDLLAPAIDFDIQLSNNYHEENIETAITNLNNNESELNQQVFSLLLFNRFTGQKTAGTPGLKYDLQNSASQSLGELLSDQLNRFSDKYVKGFDVSFDIDSYNKMVGSEVNRRSDLNVDLSKKFINNRLKLEIGGSLAVEENNNSESENSMAVNDLAGDFLAEYNLSRDGTYRIQAFNKTEFEDEIDGEVTKTGISLIFNKDFESIRDLFKVNKKKDKK